MNSLLRNHSAFLNKGKRWLTTLFAESTLIIVISMTLVALLSLNITVKEISSLSTPDQHNDFRQVTNVTLGVQQLESAARQAVKHTASPDQYDQLKVDIDVVLSMLSTLAAPSHSSTTTIRTLAGTDTTSIRERLDAWGKTIASARNSQDVSKEIVAYASELAHQAREIVIEAQLVTLQERDNQRLALYKRLTQLRWVLTAILIGFFIVVAKLILDRRRTRNVSRSLSTLNKKLEMRVARRTQQLVEGRALLLFILDACPSEVALVQADTGKVHFINREFLERLNQGPSIDTLFIQDLLVDTDERSRFINELEQFGRVDNWETKVSTHTPYWSSLSVKLVEVEGKLCYLLWGFDISKHKELLSLLELQASTDVLTTLYNRRAFYDRGAQTLESCKRYGHHCSLLMLDIDNFKKINDLHGHGAGDEAIRMVSRSLQNSLRDVDIIGRVGGEEFAVILPYTLAAQAWETAERLRCAIEKSVAECSAGDIRVTVSIGVASFSPNEPKTVEDLIAMADHALYRAKNSGRNRVETEKNESV